MHSCVAHPPPACHSHIKAVRARLDGKRTLTQGRCITVCYKMRSYTQGRARPYETSHLAPYLLQPLRTAAALASGPCPRRRLLLGQLRVSRQRQQPAARARGTPQGGPRRAACQGRPTQGGGVGVGLPCLRIQWRQGRCLRRGRGEEARFTRAWRWLWWQRVYIDRSCSWLAAACLPVHASCATRCRWPLLSVSTRQRHASMLAYWALCAESLSCGIVCNAREPQLRLHCNARCSMHAPHASRPYRRQR